MTKHYYNIKLDIPQDADSAKYFVPEGYTAKLEDGILIIEPKEREDERNEKIRKQLISSFDYEMSKYGNVEWEKGISYREVIVWLEKQKEQKVDIDKLRYCIEYINPRFLLLDNGELNIRYLRVPNEHWAEMAIDLILSFGGKIYALYRGNVKDGKLAEWPTPMVVGQEDWFSDEWLHELMDCGHNCL